MVFSQAESANAEECLILMSDCLTFADEPLILTGEYLILVNKPFSLSNLFGEIHGF